MHEPHFNLCTLERLQMQNKLESYVMLMLAWALLRTFRVCVTLSYYQSYVSKVNCASMREVNNDKPAQRQGHNSCTPNCRLFVRILVVVVKFVALWPLLQHFFQMQNNTGITLAKSSELKGLYLSCQGRTFFSSSSSTYQICKTDNTDDRLSHISQKQMITLMLD